MTCASVSESDSGGESDERSRDPDLGATLSSSSRASEKYDLRFLGAMVGWEDELNRLCGCMKAFSVGCKRKRSD